jgi:hypothetical protein
VNRGAENDQAYFELSAEEQSLYRRGQKTFSEAFYEQHRAKLEGFTEGKTGMEYVRGVVERGRWLKENHPYRSSAVNFVDTFRGANKTWSTGPDPELRRAINKLLGMTRSRR